jgi:hypothetical protein
MKKQGPKAQQGCFSRDKGKKQRSASGGRGQKNLGYNLK